MVSSELGLPICTDSFLPFFFLPFFSSFFSAVKYFVFLAMVSFSEKLISGTRIVAPRTRHSRLPLKLRSLERLPRIPDAPEPSGTQNTISYDSHPFSLGRPHTTRIRSHVQMLCSCLYVGKKKIEKTSDRARVLWGLFCRDTAKKKRFPPRKTVGGCLKKNLNAVVVVSRQSRKK